MCPKLIFCPFYFGNKLCPKCIKLTVSRIPLPHSAKIAFVPTSHLGKSFHEVVT